MFPPFPPAMELALLFVTELLFGVSYNGAVQYFETKHGNLFRFLVSWSVVFGTAGTLIIRFLFLFGTNLAEWQSLLINLMCFTGSGLPMIVGSMRRNVKPSHKAKKIPPTARRIVEDVTSEMICAAKDVNERAQAGEVKAAMLIDIVHKLHSWTGTLRAL
jgi:hypothetical protein